VIIPRIIKDTLLSILKDGAKPFRRQVNPNLAPIIHKEILKMLEAKIVVSMRHSSWVANLVSNIEKNGEIIVSVEFRNLNNLSLKIIICSQILNTY